MDVRTQNDYIAIHPELISFSTDTESFYNAVRAESLRILYVSLKDSCNFSDSLSPVCHRRRWFSIPRHSMWELWWKKV